MVALTHRGRVTILSKIGHHWLPVRRQAIIWTNATALLIGPLGTNFSEILFEIQALSIKQMGFEMSSAWWQPVCLAFSVLMACINVQTNSRKDVTHRELCLLVQFVGEIHQLVGLNRNYFIITVNIHMGKS